MRLLIDMNLSPDWVGFLGVHGYASDHWASIGRATASDIEILRFAELNDRTVLTGDLDFGIRLALSAAAKPSVIQIRSDETLPSQIGPVVIEALALLRKEIQAGALITIKPEKTRVSLLPFEST